METSIVKLEGRVDALEGDVRELAQKQEQHDSRITEMERTTIIISSDLTHIRDKIGEINSNIKTTNSMIIDDIKDLRAKREEDHYVKPLNKHEARNEQLYKWIVGGVLGALIGALMTALLSGGFFN